MNLKLFFVLILFITAGYNSDKLNNSNSNRQKNGINMELQKETGAYKYYFALNKTESQEIKIHFLEKNIFQKDKLSIVYSPGLWEPAERALPLFDGLDYHCVALSYRGRGESETPISGYDLHHHISDFKTVIDALKLEDIVIVAFSRGVGYACGYIEKYPERVKGLIIVDHSPVHLKPSEGYADFWKNLVYLGRPITEFMRPVAIEGIEKEAQMVYFWEMLAKLKIPVKVLRGVSSESKIQSDMTEEDAKNYIKYVENLELVDFKYSGHMIPDEELGKYRREVDLFIKNRN